MQKPVRFSRSGLTNLIGAVGASLLIFIAPPAISEKPAHPDIHGALGVFVRGSRLLTPGTEAALRIAAHAAPSDKESSPLAGVSVSVSLSGGGRTAQLSEGMTSRSGSLDARFVVPGWPAGKYQCEVRARIADQVSVQSHTVELAAAARTLLQSDKPLYQPGQIVHLRSLTMRTQDGRPLQGGKMRFVVEDPRRNRILQVERPVSAFGISSVDLPLADELLLGKYEVRAELIGSGDTPQAEPTQSVFEVSRYVLPKLKVSLHSEQSYYEPGAEVRFTVSASYFQGKAVAGGKVTVRANFQTEGLLTPLPTLSGRLDESGKLALKLPLPKEIPFPELKLVLDAAVEDAATQRAETRSELLIAQNPIQIDIVPETGQLLSEVSSRISVLAARPDGAPIPNVNVSVSIGAASPVTLRATTNAIGLATVEHRLSKPQKGVAKDGRCAAGEISVSAQVTIPSRPPVSEQRCLGVRTEGGLLLRSDRAVYPRGEAMGLSVAAPSVKEGVCFVDVMRDQQLQDTLTIPIHSGAGQVTVPPSARLSGTVALLAYLVGADGKQVRDSRLVYIERPSALRVSAQAEPASGASGERGRTLRPGDEARIRLRVVDADSGVGVAAAVGLVMVDEALLALRPLRPGLLRAYFSLGAEARKAAAQRRFAPGGVGVDALIEKGGLSDLEQQAAKLLLSGASAPWDSGWETDPWQDRRQALVVLNERWSRAVHRYEPGHWLGERISGQRGKWRYRSDLPSLLRAAGVLTQSEMLDPWRQKLTSEMLIEAAALPQFEEYAQGQLDERLTVLYRALWKQLDADLKSGQRSKGKDGGVEFTETDLARLSASMLVDPWGGTLHVQLRKRLHKVGPLSSHSVVYSAGPDGVFGNADDLYPSDNLCYHHSCPGSGRQIEVVGVSAADAFSEASIGCGCGYGSAGGALAGRSSHAVMMRSASAESLGVAGKKDSVRSNFPETLLYRPEVLTDEQGEATVPLTMADSITTWRLLAEAVAQDGRLGSLMMGVPVTQDFFVDLDLPPVITQHDELAIPIPVYNHLKLAQRVTLTLLQDPWFEPLGPLVETMELGPGQAGVRYFRIKAGAVGKHALRLSARGAVASDAVERRVEVVPDGIERVSSVQERLVGQRVSHSVSVPAMVIPGTGEAVLKIYPGASSQVIEGLDSLLRMPHGCFEQTSSTTYPNALILQYLRRTRRSNPELERRATEYLTMGYQKLLSFEVSSGGFSWFGNAPAHKVLTAYGLEEFSDMAEVFAVDPKVISRIQKWLLSQQRSDGSFEPDKGGIREGAIDAMADDRLRTTAYVALAIKRTDAKGTHQAAVERARAFVRRTLLERVISDPYTLALTTELVGGSFVPLSAKGESALPLIEKLWATRHPATDGRSQYFVPSTTTPTHGGGKSGIVETTAIAASALQRSAALSRSAAALSYLRAAKDSFGTWHSTQATIRALKAMLLADSGTQSRVEGTLEVLWNGASVSTVGLAGLVDGVQIVSLPTPVAGSHQMSLQFIGRGAIDYQLVTRYYIPPQPSGQTQSSLRSEAESLPIGVTMNLSAVAIQREQSVVQTAHLSVRRDAMMPLLSLGIPPGFTVDREGLDLMVVRGQIEKYELTPRFVTLYLQKLQKGDEKQYPVTMTAHLPGRVQIPAGSVYPYYEPELRAQAEPIIITVRE